MGTMNFSIPDDLKDKFNEVFKDQNQSAVITELMRRAVEERERAAQRIAAIAAARELRKSMPAISQDEIRSLREELRK